MVVGISTMGHNDGLSFEDFKAWFDGATGGYAVIHFTKFRY